MISKAVRASPTAIARPQAATRKGKSPICRLRRQSAQARYKSGSAPKVAAKPVILNGRDDRGDLSKNLLIRA
jgi:hypothetical protein